VAQETTGARLRRLGEAKGLTRYRLAKVSGVAESYIYRIENDEIKNPRRDTLQKLAQGFNIPLVEIIGETQPIDAWQLVEQSLKAYIPVYSGLYEVGMSPIDHVVCTRAEAAPETLRGYRWDGLYLEPEILPGDIVIVDSSISPVGGDLVMVAQREGAFGSRKAAIRRYKENEGGMGIVADNETVCDLDEGGCCSTDGMCVYGVVTELVRKLR
jgi:transcriptional regulator with XRE-family HTH domain